MFKKYFKENSDFIKKIILATKGLCLLLLTISMVKANATLFVSVTILGFVCTELLTLISDKKEDEKPN